MELGNKLGFQVQHIELAAEKFKRHHRSKGSRSCDWQAEFQKWLIGDAERARTGGRRPEHATGREWANSRGRSNGN
jgi:hypothetical protein